MTPGKYEAFVKKIVDASMSLSASKRHDYATTDALANFKRMTEIARLYNIDFSRLHHYALFMTLMKLDRLQNLLSQNKVPKNESMADTEQDAFNYLMLTFACLEEETNPDKEV
jgi:hypothetical protein